MPMLDWLVAAGFEITAGDSVREIERVGAASKSLLATLQAVETASLEVSAGIVGMTTAARAAVGPVTSLDAALRAVARSSRSAGRSAADAASGFYAEAAAANAAAEAVGRYGAARAASGTPGGVGAGAGSAGRTAATAAATTAFLVPRYGAPPAMPFSSPAVVPAGAAALAGGASRSWRDVGGGLTGQVALPSAAAWAYGGGRGGPPMAGTYIPPGTTPPNIPFARRIPGTGGPIPPIVVPPGGGGGGGGGGGSSAAAAGAGGGAMRAARWGATIAAGGAVDALYEAGRLQQKLTLIQVATGANQTQMKRIEQMSYAISDMTAQSAAQTAGVIGVMAASGINDPKMLLAKDRQGRTFAEIVAKFADVQYLKSNGEVSFETGTKELIQLAHLYRAYKPDDISHVADQVSKLSFMMPDSLNRYLTQAGYYVPLLSRLGVPQDESLVIGAFLDRMGLGRGKGGTSVQNFTQALMKPLTMTGHMQRGQMKAVQELGIYDERGVPNARIFQHDADGHPVLSVLEALKTINEAIHRQTDHLKGEARARRERQLIGDFQKAFGVQGQRFGLLGDDKGRQQLMWMLDQMKKMPGVEQAQSKFMQNFIPQSTRAWSNFQSLMTEVGSQAIPGATEAMRSLGDTTHNAQGWLHKHSEVERDLARDANTAAHAVAGLGIAITGLAGASLLLYTNAHKAADWVTKHLPQPPDRYGGTSPVKSPAELRKMLAGKRLGVGPRADGGLRLPGWSLPQFFQNDGDSVNYRDLNERVQRGLSQPGGPRRQHTREVHHHHGPIVIQSGADPHQVGVVVKHVLSERDRHAAQFAQHNLSRYGSNVTSPTLPSILTVKPAGR